MGVGESDGVSAEAQLAELMKRVEALEHQHRRTREHLFATAGVVILASIALSAVIALGVGIGTRMWPRDVLRARKIELVDADRRVRSYMYTDRQGVAGLTIRDTRGKSRASLCVAKDGDPYLLLHGPSGKSCVSVSMEGEQSGVFMRDRQHVQRTALTVGGTGNSQLWLSDGEGQARVWLVSAQDGLAGLALFDTAGERRATLSVSGSGKAALVLKDGESRVRRK